MDREHHGTAYHGGGHYENFPVGSWLLPAPMRAAVLALYRFARTGDDLADEGSLSPTQRLAGLQALQEGLRGPLALATPCSNHELANIGTALRVALNAHGVSTQSAEDLLSAFRQDVHNPILSNEDAVLDYCSRSANPVGRLILALAGILEAAIAPEDLLRDSDAICTGLQLANFAQDMGEDIGRGRHYVPDAWLHHTGVTDRNALVQQRPDELPQRMAQWAHAFLMQGGQLPGKIRRSKIAGRLRLAIEVALCVEGGLAICQRVLASPQTVWVQSPRISKHHLPVLLLRALRRSFQ